MQVSTSKVNSALITKIKELRQNFWSSTDSTQMG